MYQTCICKIWQYFPGISRPRVLQIDVRNPDGTLAKVQKQIAMACLDIGFQPEEHAFLPHVTLLRIKYSNASAFRDVLYKYRNYNFGVMRSYKICLMESNLTPRGPIYEEI